MSPPAEESYVPAAGRAWLTSLYDPAIKLTTREGAFRPAVVEAVLEDPRPRTVLDMGCGTGTLLGLLAAADPSVRLLGMDGDQQVLALAREKTAVYGDRVRLSKGLATALPIEDGSVDVVSASLLLHHLSSSSKLDALQEASRVLVPGGRLVIADWGRPHDPLMRASFFVLQLLDGFSSTRDHAAGYLSALVAQAGFEDVAITKRWRTVLGSLELLTASRRSASHASPGRGSV